MKTDEIRAKQGHTVAWTQFKMPYQVPEFVASDEYIPELTITEDDNEVKISGKTFNLVFGKKVGTITGLEYFNTEIFKSKKTLRYDFRRRRNEPHIPPALIYESVAGPVINLYKAPADNDRPFMRAWRNSELWNLTTEVQNISVNKIIAFTTEIKVDVKSVAKDFSVLSNSTYTIYGGG